MIDNRKLDLQLFAEGGGEGGAAGGEGSESAAEFHVGDTLPDGTYVDENLASSMRENAGMYLDRSAEAHAQGQQATETMSQQAGTEPQEATAEEWEAAKKKFAKFYGEDVKGAVNKRFKNQADAGKQLESLKPMLDVMMKKAGVNSVEELQQAVLNDDSLYEEEAEERGMSVEALRQFKELEAKNQQFENERQQAAQQAQLQDLMRQEQELKQLYPQFDLVQEMQNPEFRAWVTDRAHPMSVERAYYAIHGKELQAQTMAYGIEAGRDQTAKAIQANGMRPTEGASRGGSTGGVMTAPDRFTEEQYEQIKSRMLGGELVSL